MFSSYFLPMSHLTIMTGDDTPCLRKVAEKVTKFDKTLITLLQNMADTMMDEDGIGLAAPQVDVNKRVILVGLFSDDQEEMTSILPMINPEILHYSVEEVVMEEGCLSLPGKFAKVKRPASIKVKFQDHQGKETTMSFDRLTSRVIQHEIDHLEGVLFTDKIVGPIRTIDKKTRKEERFMV